MIESMILDQVQPRINVYFIDKVREVLERPVIGIKEAYRSVEPRIPSRTTPTVIPETASAFEAIDAAIHLEQVKARFFLPDRPEIDTSFMDALESWNAERRHAMESYEPESTPTGDIVFG